MVPTLTVIFMTRAPGGRADPPNVRAHVTRRRGPPRGGACAGPESSEPLRRGARQGLVECRVMGSAYESTCASRSRRDDASRAEPVDDAASAERTRVMVSVCARDARTSQCDFVVPPANPSRRLIIQPGPSRRTAMRFLILAYGFEKDWKTLSKSQQDELLAQDDLLRARGAIIDAVAPATTVRAWVGTPR